MSCKKVVFFFTIIASACARSTVDFKKTDSDSYGFSYHVDEGQNNFGHQEIRNGDVTTGEYRTLLPDGRVQIVSYKADENGYDADVKYVTQNEAKLLPPAIDPKRIPHDDVLDRDFHDIPNTSNFVPILQEFLPASSNPRFRPHFRPPHNSPFKPITVPFSSIPPSLTPTPFPNTTPHNDLSHSNIPFIIPPSPLRPPITHSPVFPSAPRRNHYVSTIPTKRPFKHHPVPYKSKHNYHSHHSSEDKSNELQTNAHSYKPKKEPFYKPIYLVTRNPHNIHDPYGIKQGSSKNTRVSHSKNKIMRYPGAHESGYRPPKQISLQSLMHKFYRPKPNPYFKPKRINIHQFHHIEEEDEEEEGSSSSEEK